ncbi:OsmC family peroxiredoxin [Amycolatopsis rhizosphaerae]|uniref:OsmC family peroxiredoxin n=1 Tax=Amycolatopsis rhizosphaerae TaxID=2053003 RepID=A0A558B8Q6_9PSEU|nr:OsmC family protein [Amycolatopsis rhizosphaerae]TVT32897.1 OsmC family peroxiredoxin [Amycolatopsis rhizosphaerae]
MGLEVQRVGEHEFLGRNERGAEGAFSPAELLEIATAGCSAVTAEQLIMRRPGDNSRFSVAVSADRQEDAAELDALHIRFDVDLSALDGEERAALATAVNRAIDRLCTVSRTLKKGIPVYDEFPAE